MNANEVRNIVLEVVAENNEIVQTFLEITPNVNTKKACKILKCSRKWLYKNAISLGGKRSNKRGDLIFETLKLVQFIKQKKPLSL